VCYCIIIIKYQVLAFFLAVGAEKMGKIENYCIKKRGVIVVVWEKEERKRIEEVVGHGSKVICTKLVIIVIYQAKIDDGQTYE